MSTSNHKPLCIIPARGGSKRLPRKNITLLGDKPLLAWSIEPALKSGIFDTVWVSSEDEEILRTAQEWGAQALPRDNQLAGDRVTVAQLCWHIMQDFLAKGEQYSALYVLLPTSPFRRRETIRQAWNAFLESRADALFSVVPLDHPPQWALTQTEGWLTPLMPIEYESPRQGLAPTYRHDGGHAIANFSTFLNTQKFLGPRTLAFPVPLEEAVDVNEPIDLAWAEFLLQQGMVNN